MNKKAQELKLENTHFVTPHGLDQKEHYTTAYELAKLTNYALNNKKFATIVNTKTATININGNPKTINNTNELLGNLNGVDGVKTGFTNNAGRCLVTSTTRNGHQIICVVLGADTKKIRTTDSVKLIEYAFSNYEYIDINTKIQSEFSNWIEENCLNIHVIKGNKSNPVLTLSELPYNEIPIPKNNIKDLKVAIDCPKTLNAPIQEGEVLGKLELKLKDETLLTLEIKSSVYIAKKTIPDYIKQLLFNYSHYLQGNNWRLNERSNLFTNFK